MYLPVSSIASSGGCSKRLYPAIRDETGLPRAGYRRRGRDTSTDEQKVGTAVHRIIQFVLEHNPSDRSGVSQYIREELIRAKDELLLPASLIEILGEDYLVGAVLHRRLMKTWREGADLLKCALNLLSELESRIPKSVGEWKISSEDRIHEMATVQRQLFGETLSLHGDVDLVFRYENFHILGELKTGMKQQWKVDGWKRQIEIYLDLWKEIHPDILIAGVIIHRGLYNGFEWVHPNPTWFELFNNPEEEIPGIYCNYCELKSECPSSYSAIATHPR